MKILTYGGIAFKRESIVQYLADGSARVYIEKPGEYLIVEPIYRELPPDWDCGMPAQLVGYNFWRIKNLEGPEKIPLDEFRPISARALKRIEYRLTRARTTARIRDLHDQPHMIAEQAAMY